MPYPKSVRTAPGARLGLAMTGLIATACVTTESGVPETRLSAMDVYGEVATSSDELAYSRYSGFYFYR